MAITIFIALAGLMGAAGIALAAASAHAAPGAGLDSAAYMLLFHAAALVGGAALMQQGVLWRPLAFIVLAAWLVGAGLFPATSPCGRSPGTGCFRLPRHPAA
jgi:uncharacterized membrane protein YgdD (TMEM256/DUF423 family)